MARRYPSIEAQLAAIETAGLRKRERILSSPQDVEIRTADGRTVLNLCANNYLGLANHPEMLAAAASALRTHGFGMASVRFICGTQDLHKHLEGRIAEFFGTEDAILYSSCFDANCGLFETLLGSEDAVLSDALNHASLIDGIRLCKAKRLRYAHADMEDLERRLREAAGARMRLIATDGVFSMDGDLAPLDRIVKLAERYEAMVLVDDSHATGVVGSGGRGTAEHFGVGGRIDLYTSTLGKALGGGSGGFVAAAAPVVALLRERSRPYLFSNSVAPPLVAAATRALELVAQSGEARLRLRENARVFRSALQAAGFTLRPGEHPIIPVMLGEAGLAQRMADALLEAGIYVIAFSYPVVPEGAARIRVQLSAAHTHEHVEHAADAFIAVGRSLGVIA